MTPPRCRTAEPLDTQDLRLLALWLDAQATTDRPQGIPHTLAARLVATAYDREAREEAAWAMLAVDVEPFNPDPKDA